MPIQYSLNFVDRDGNKAEHRTNLETGSPTSFGELVSYFNAYATVVGAMSDATITSGDIVYRSGPLGNPAAGVNSNAYRRAVLISLGNTGKYASFNIPSPRLDLLDTTGPYIGKRILQQIAVVNAAWLSTGASLVPLVDLAGNPITAPFLVGGLTQ